MGHSRVEELHNGPSAEAFMHAFLGRFNRAWPSSSIRAFHLSWAARLKKKKKIFLERRQRSSIYTYLTRAHVRAAWCFPIAQFAHELLHTHIMDGLIGIDRSSEYVTVSMRPTPMQQPFDTCAGQPCTRTRTLWSTSTTIFVDLFRYFYLAHAHGTLWSAGRSNDESMVRLITRR
jgi:hypothetical protein